MNAVGKPGHFIGLPDSKIRQDFIPPVLEKENFSCYNKINLPRYEQICLMREIIAL